MSSTPPPSPPPAAVLRGHAAEVTAVRITPWLDEQELPLLLSAGGDGEVRLWSLRTHRAVASVAAHGGAGGHSATVLAVHALGASTVLSQGRDGRVRAWDAADGALRGPLLELPAECYNFCACAPSPALVAAGAPVGGGGGGAAATAATLALPSADANEVVLWDVRTRAPARTLAPSTALGKAGMCMCVRFADDGRLLAGWEDGSLQLFDLRGGGGGGGAGSGGGGAAAAARKLHSQPLLSIDVDPAGATAVSGAADCALCVASLAGGEVGAPTRLDIPVTSEASGSGGVASLAVRPDRKLLAAGGWDKRVRLWQWKRWKPLAVLKQHTETVTAVHFSADSRWLASASNDRTIALWDVYPP